jgi:hypothetical protein
METFDGLADCRTDEPGSETPDIGFETYFTIIHISGTLHD